MRFWGVLVLLAWMMLGCNLQPASEKTIVPTRADEALQGDVWVRVTDAIEYREVFVDLPNGLGFLMHIVRIDPTQVRFRIHYDSTYPHAPQEWQNHLSDAVVFINGGFFDTQNRAQGLLVVDGQSIGQSYVGFGGMFQVDTEGVARVRSLVHKSYRGEGLIQAVQAFPMLIEYGGQLAPTGRGFDDPARRSIIGQDAEGHILFISTGVVGQISLRDVQQWLFQSDLALDVAFALDGGKSSTLYVQFSDRPALLVPAFSDLPIVLAVYPK
jgi:exopolysaccharide biosynthesis protein